MLKPQEISKIFSDARLRQGFIESELASINNEIKNIETQKTTKIAEKDKHENVIKASKLILEKLVLLSKENIEVFLSYSLKQIFTDRNYDIQFVIREDAKRPSLELTLVDNGVSQEITDAVGGGILSAIGLLLQIYYLEVYGLSKVMFIDEGLKEISTGNTVASEYTVNYLQNTLNYLKYLSENFGYKFIIITHDNNVRSVASRIYEVNSGGVTLCL